MVILGIKNKYINRFLAVTIYPIVFLVGIPVAAFVGACNWFNEIIRAIIREWD